MSKEVHCVITVGRKKVIFIMTECFVTVVVILGIFMTVNQELVCTVQGEIPPRVNCFETFAHYMISDDGICFCIVVGHVSTGLNNIGTSVYEMRAYKL